MTWNRHPPVSRQHAASIALVQPRAALVPAQREQGAIADSSAWLGVKEEA